MQINELLNGYGKKFCVYVTLEEMHDLVSALEYAQGAIIQSLGKYERGDEALLKRIQDMHTIIQRETEE